MRIDRFFKGFTIFMFTATFIFIMINKINDSHMDYQYWMFMLIFWIGALIINKK